MPAHSGVQVWLALWKATSAIEVHAGRSGMQLQMCRSDFAILEALLQQGPLPVNTLGREMALTSGSATTAINRLENRHLVRRVPQEEDRRVCLVELTDEGRALIENASDNHSALMESACSGLTRADRKILLGLLEKLGLAAESLAEKECRSPRKEDAPTKDQASFKDPPSNKDSSQPPAEEIGFAGFTDLD
ncbi:MAG: transcriptional regulator, MarR family [Verrucomicrobiales bacterium]|nr:transcriptional regulator, MarR family [Verrucomicrobiales bacterium]